MWGRRFFSSTLGYFIAQDTPLIITEAWIDNNEEGVFLGVTAETAWTSRAFRDMVGQPLFANNEINPLSDSHLVSLVDINSEEQQWVRQMYKQLPKPVILGNIDCDVMSMYWEFGLDH